MSSWTKTPQNIPLPSLLANRLFSLWLFQWWALVLRSVLFLLCLLLFPHLFLQCCLHLFSLLSYYLKCVFWDASYFTLKVSFLWLCFLSLSPLTPWLFSPVLIVFSCCHSPHVSCCLSSPLCISSRSLRVVHCQRFCWAPQFSAFYDSSCFFLFLVISIFWTCLSTFLVWIK